MTIAVAGIFKLRRARLPASGEGLVNGLAELSKSLGICDIEVIALEKVS